MKASRKTVLKSKLAREGITIQEYRRARNAHRNRTYGPRRVPKGTLMLTTPWLAPWLFGRRPLERKGGGK